DHSPSNPYPGTEPPQIEIFLAQPDGSFVLSGTYANFPEFQATDTLERPYGTTQPVLGDFNGDGNLDIAVFQDETFPSETFVQLLFGDGTGNFVATNNRYLMGE